MSDNYVEYSPNFPRATDAETGQPYCRAEHEVSDAMGEFICTRPPGHDGRHEAGIGDGLIAASWDRPTVGAVETITPRSET